MAITAQSAYDAYNRLKRDLTDVPLATFWEWTDFINKTAYRKLKGIDPERYIDQDTTYSVSTNPSTQALPADFRDIEEKECGFYYVDTEGDNTEVRLARLPFGSKGKGYYIQGTNVVFTGIESSETYRLRYIPEITTIDASTDYFTLDTSVSGAEIIPDDFLEYIVKAVDVLYDQWDEDIGAESFADARFVRIMDELARNFKKEPMAYSLPDSTLIY
jgi:hypothetical protein